ncbi:Imm5 family immunity protein [Xanthocytophaga agilis]|uniref:Imm5 family immunity protein n=1 Tax=Xanthocytophaga agilis TaxID=3048010 RepID=A0AAE3UGU0_9BACT|nr:Imm5 family immunity protein [Xanthocytophaga agilis]MDJ1505333.1 Imm5 family immunity protein [Xanthocytophaga agilis]
MEKEKMSTNFFLNTQLTALIEKGFSCIESHPCHHLESGIREAIYLALGAHHDPIAHKRRRLLAQQAINKVAPLWYTTWPQDTLLMPLLDRFIRYKERRVVEKNEFLYTQLDEDWERMSAFADNTWIQDPLHRKHRFAESMVGLTVVLATELVLFDSFVTSEESFLPQKDEEIDLMENELHFYAAFAYAGGPPFPMHYFGTGSPEKYKDYWTWWLQEALPYAWKEGMNK